MSVTIYCLGLTALRMTYILSLTGTTEDPTEASKVWMVNENVRVWGAPRTGGGLVWNHVVIPPCLCLRNHVDISIKH